MGTDTSGFVAGHYSGAFTGGEENDASNLDIGTTETGYTMRPVFYREDIRIDDLGDTLADGIFRGYNISLSFELVQWVTDIKKILQPIHSADWGKLDPTLIGKTMQHLAGSLVLTPVVGINENLKAMTFHKVIPEGEHGAFTMHTRMRRMPCSFLCLPVLAPGATQYRFFTPAA